MPKQTITLDYSDYIALIRTVGEANGFIQAVVESTPYSGQGNAGRAINTRLDAALNKVQASAEIVVAEK